MGSKILENKKEPNNFSVINKKEVVASKIISMLLAILTEVRLLSSSTTTKARFRRNK
jgi:hypothetical protein